MHMEESLQCLFISIMCFYFLFLLLGMDPGIPRGTSFTNLIEDSYNDYMSGSSHISDEDSVPQAQTFSQMSPPQVESTTKKSQRGINFSI